MSFCNKLGGSSEVAQRVEGNEREEWPARKLFGPPNAVRVSCCCFCFCCHLKRAHFSRLQVAECWPSRRAIDLIETFLAVAENGSEKNKSHAKHGESLFAALD